MLKCLPLFDHCQGWCLEVAQGASPGVARGHSVGLFAVVVFAAPIGLSPLHIPALCGSELVVVVSTEPPDDLSCWTTPGLAVPETGCCPCR